MYIPYMYIIYLVYLYHHIYIYIYIYMTYSFHRKIKFVVTRNLKNMCAPGSKIKIKK